MEEILTPLKTRTVTGSDYAENHHLVAVESEQEKSQNQIYTVQSPDDALKALQSKPDFDLLKRVLHYLDSATAEADGFNIKIPSPKTAQIIFVLVADIVPDYWKLLASNSTSVHRKQKHLLLRCLGSVSGIGAIAARLRMFLDAKDEAQSHEKSGINNKAQAMEELLEVLEALLKGNGFLFNIWAGVYSLPSKPSQRTLLWKDFTATLAGGKLLSLAAEADHAVNELSPDAREGSWLGDGCQYSSWLGKNLAYMLTNFKGEQGEDWKALAQLLNRAMSIGYTVQDSTILKDALTDWLTGVSGDGIGQDHAIHRAVIAALFEDHSRAMVVFNKSLEIFGDKLSIKHTPMLHQEVNTQVLLMIAGYIYRKDNQQLSTLARSSLYLSAISNRFASSSPRASLLGMVTGTAISELVDPKEKRMNFSTEEINSAEWQWYRNLTKITDQIGLISDLKVVSTVSKRKHPSSSPTSTSKSKPLKPSTQKPPESRIISIEDLDDNSDSDEDLPMYRKPDSDHSDSDEDATLVQRDRPVAPVYIRDLVAGLRDTENYDRYKLAISTAPSLIRRKANFGTEVTEHIEDLASLLVSLSDKYDMEKFHEMRLQGMIAVLIAQPVQMGQWFSRTFFNGDYSIGQRASILTAIGLGARELAGFQKEDAALLGADALPDTSFPSQKLPEKLHEAFSPSAGPSSSSALNRISKSVERLMIQPMAVSAADKLSGPNALKIRTFSSRMAVEKKRPKPTSNALAKIVAEAFFLPLTGLWRLHLQTHTSLPPPLLPPLLQTLSLLLHASGPSALAMPLLTSEFWPLLLSLRFPSASSTTTALDPRTMRPHALDPHILEAVLFGLLTVLDVNREPHQRERLVREHARELLETRAWVDGVVGGGRAEGKVGVLGAAVLGAVGEVVGEWGRVLGGEMGGWL